MISFKVNGVARQYEGDLEKDLLSYLRNELHLTAAKDGCSGEGVCGACTVHINGKAKLACRTKIGKLQDAEIVTLEGLETFRKETLAKTMVNNGAVQCGFCTPGFIMKADSLLRSNPNPTPDEIQKGLKSNICRCTGYKKIESAILEAADHLQNNQEVDLITTTGKLGEPQIKYGAYETALGDRRFVADYFFENMGFAALKFSDYPKAKVLKIDSSDAEKLEGVWRIFTKKDVPGSNKIGLIRPDWSLMIGEGEITHYIGNVIAGVVAESEEIARKAVDLIKIEYEVLTPVTDVFEALKDENRVHEQYSNHIDTSVSKIGDSEKAFAEADFIVEHRYETQRIEHAFMEVEAAIALPVDDGIELLSESQGIYEDRRQVSEILGIDEEKVRVRLIPNGGGFGGKEDLSIQGHTALFAYLLQKPVKLVLTRQESIKVHPKRHPVFMDFKVGATKEGKLTAVKLEAYGDTGAYMSVGTKVLERVAGHATGGYFVPNVDINAKTIYTNNIPCGAMRGFGANQAVFGLESAIDEICEMAGFDRWQFRFDNALEDGLSTGTGQTVYQVGVKECLLQLKEPFYNNKYVGLAAGIKNSGVGNGMNDESDCIITIVSPEKVILKHGWTEMGQGVNTVAVQMLCEETGIDPEIIEVQIDTEAGIKTGMTTSSRATALLGNSIIDSAKEFKKDLENSTLEKLVGRTYRGRFVCDWTTKPGSGKENPIIHYSYGYAAQLVVLNDEGKIDTVYAAHDAGRIVNPIMYEGQIEGAVHMGVGYALTEDLPMKDGYLISDKYKDLGILRTTETPKIVVLPVEVADSVGAHGVKGIGEIGLVPTAGAVANALYQFDKIRRFKLPLMRK
ncbi:MAG: selenium-dependent xanthine dehydrogenase [Bacteroidales bacterium]|nr:selenium-dependent xanthine dehydrogenase [Bacteroidales bacterium]